MPAFRSAGMNQSRTLTIGKREGSFKGMLKERTFNVVLVTPDKPAGFLSMPAPEQTVKYNGKLLRLKLD
jgi:alpha-D-xyloside xylohydrolase